MLDILEKLVSFDSTSSKPNQPLIAWVAGFLESHGIPSRIIPGAEGGKASLVASMGPSGKPGVVLSGHTDVVPVAGQAWSCDPFHLTRKDGKAYGRGTCDMKGGIACALSVMASAAKAPLDAPIHLVLTHDEETGMEGIRELVPMLPGLLGAPMLAVVLEPTGLACCNAHKGFQAHEAVFHGLPAHSSQPQKGKSAIHAAARFVVALEQYAAKLAHAPLEGSQFDPPYTSFNVGKIAGGEAINIVAGECRVVFEYRIHPGDDEQAIAAAIDAMAKNCGLPAEVVRGAGGKPLLPSISGEAAKLAAMMSGNAPFVACPYATEAPYFQQSGIPTLVWGPGDLQEAHKPDEFVRLSDLEACKAGLMRLAGFLQRR